MAERLLTKTAKWWCKKPQTEGAESALWLNLTPRATLAVAECGLITGQMRTHHATAFDKELRRCRCRKKREKRGKKGGKKLTPRTLYQPLWHYRASIAYPPAVLIAYAFVLRRLPNLNCCQQKSVDCLFIAPRLPLSHSRRSPSATRSAPRCAGDEGISCRHSPPLTRGAPDASSFLISLLPLSGRAEPSLATASDGRDIDPAAFSGCIQVVGYRHPDPLVPPPKQVVKRPTTNDKRRSNGDSSRLTIGVSSAL